MCPTLFRLGPWELRSYGVMLMLSFVVGVFVARPRARAAGISWHRLGVFSVAIVVAALVGSRLAYVAVNPSEFADDWWAVFLPARGGGLRVSGLVMNGGVVAAAAALWGLSRFYRIPVLRTLDVFAPTLPLGEFLTRIGCYLNGCCYGVPTSTPWGVVFPRGTPAGTFQRSQPGHPLPVHPTQLYSAGLALAVFVVLLVMERRARRFEGFTTLLFFLLYGTSRFVVEGFRHYSDETGVVLGLTHNQILSLGLVAGSTVGLAVLGARARRAGGPGEGVTRNA